MKKLLFLFLLPSFGFSQDIILNGSVKVEGGLEINSPQQSNQAVTKEYVDNKVSVLNVNMDFINDFVGDGSKLYVRHWDTEGTSIQNVAFEQVVDDGKIKQDENYSRAQIINPKLYNSDEDYNIFDSYALKSLFYNDGYSKFYQDNDQDGNFELESEEVFSYITCNKEDLPFELDLEQSDQSKDYNELITSNKIINIDENTIILSSQGFSYLDQDSYIFKKIGDSPSKYLLTSLTSENFLSPTSNKQQYEGMDHELYGSNYNIIFQEVSYAEAEALYNQWQAADNNCGLTFSEWYNTVITQN